MERVGSIVHNYQGFFQHSVLPHLLQRGEFGNNNILDRFNEFVQSVLCFDACNSSKPQQREVLARIDKTPVKSCCIYEGPEPAEEVESTSVDDMNWCCTYHFSQGLELRSLKNGSSQHTHTLSICET